MARVSENSNTASLNYAMSQAKTRLEDLQLKGAILKRMTKPSDDPISNIELMNINSTNNNNKQFTRNIGLLRARLQTIENIFVEVISIINKAKEITIAQASDIYNPSVRKNVAQQVFQLRLQTISMANSRPQNRYIFGGHKTTAPPFDSNGIYHGDSGQIPVEIVKDFYIPSNIPGNEIFYERDVNFINKDFNKEVQDYLRNDNPSVKQDKMHTTQDSIFDQLKSLEIGLRTNDSDSIQGLLERFDRSLDRIITLQTKIGSWLTTVDSVENSIVDEELINSERKSIIEDLDVAKVYSDLIKQENILKATYKIGSNLINENLLSFLR